MSEIRTDVPLVEMRDIYKSFGSVDVLKGVNFVVNRPEIIGLLGDNGAGKSTLIKILTGVHTPTRGQIFFEGRPVQINSPHAARELGIETVYQDLALVPLISIARNFWLGQELTRQIGPFRVLNHREMSERTREALADIEPRLALPQIYSGVMGRVRGEPGTSVSLGFRDARDEPVERTLTRRPMPGELTKFGNLPPLVARLEHERVDAGDGVTAGVIRFNVWMIPIAQEFARAIDELRDVDGVILDLRGNIGGVAGMIMGIAGHFMREVVPLGTMRTRSGELRIVSNPQRVNSRGERVEPLDVPLAIVLDGLSFSTTEVFAGGLQAVGRARVFGETSGGQALPAIMERLPNGDVLMQAIADFTAPNGERMEGRGVVPDETVPLTRADLLAGRDAPVEAALRWIREQASEREGGS